MEKPGIFAIGMALLLAALCSAAAAEDGDKKYLYHNEDTIDATPRDTLSALTGGTIFNGTDRFLSVWDYPTVDFNDLYLYTGVDDNGFNAAAAKKFGGAYLGLLYGGKLFDDLVPLFTGNRLGNMVSYDAFNSEISSSVDTPAVAVRNNVEFLLGFRNIGIRLSYNEIIRGRNMESDDFFEQYDNNNTAIYGKTVDEVKADLVPGLEIGAWWHLNSGTLLKLRAGGTVGIHQQKAKKINSIVFDGDTDKWTADTEDSLEANYLKPAGFAGVGMDFGVDTPRQFGFSVTGGYALWMFQNLEDDTLYTAIIKNEHKYSGTDAEFFVHPNLWIQAFVSPRVSLRTDIDVDVRVGTSNKYDDQDQTNTIVHQLVTMVPTLDFMVNTVVVPEKLTVHTGLDTTLHQLRVSTETTIAKRDHTETLFLPNVRLRAGITFKATPRLSAAVMLAAGTATNGIENVLGSLLYRY